MVTVSDDSIDRNRGQGRLLSEKEREKICPESLQGGSEAQYQGIQNEERKE